MKKSFQLAICLCLLVACHIKKDASEAKQVVFPLATSKYTILPFNESNKYLFKDGKETTLSEEELILLEELFQKKRERHNFGQARALAKRNIGNPENALKKTGFELETKGFKRQYLPVINKKDEKEVWINFFCNDNGANYWREKALIVKDGDNCYYNCIINLTTKEVYDLHINGYDY